MSVNTEVSGRFGQALTQAMEENKISMRDLAEKLEISYEHVRKLVNGRGQPSNIRLKEICRVLGLKYETMEQLVTADRMLKKYGKSMYKALGKDPRAGELESAGLDVLNKDQFNMVINMVQGLAKGNRKTGS